MNQSRFLAPLILALALGGCEFVGSAVAPSVTGREATETAAAQPATIVPLDASKLGTPSATPVGASITQFRSDLAQLQQAAVQQVQRATQLHADMDASVTGYQIATSTIKKRPQDGLTADESIGTWQQAQAHLRAVSATLDQMNGLSSEVAKNVAYSAYLEQSIHAAGTRADASAEDRRQLGVLEESAKQTSTSLNQALDGMRQQVLSGSRFLGTEGAKLAQIAPPALGTTPNIATAPQQPATPSAPSATPAAPAGPAGAGLATGRPFVVIRFDNPGVEYEQQLYEAVSAALARSPEVAFDLVGVVPATGTSEEIAQNSEAVRASTEKVMHSLVNMGLPADRISVSQMTDPNIQSNEVHLYVR